MTSYETISIILSGFAIALSIITWGERYFSRRTKLTLEIDQNGRALSVGEYSEFATGKEVLGLTIPCYIINEVESSVSITQIQFWDSQGAVYRAAVSPEFAFHRFRKLVDTEGFYERIDETAIFPINLGPMQASYELLRVMLPMDVCLVGAKVVTNKRTKDVSNVASSVQILINQYRNIEDNRHDTENAGNP